MGVLSIVHFVRESHNRRGIKPAKFLTPWCNGLHVSYVMIWDGRSYVMVLWVSLHCALVCNELHPLWCYVSFTI